MGSNLHDFEGKAAVEQAVPLPNKDYYLECVPGSGTTGEYLLTSVWILWLAQRA